GNIKSNGNDNFKYAVEGICDGSIKQGVWVAYKNISNGKMSVHKGACIKQAQDYSDDFYSFDFNYSLPVMLIKKIDKLKDSVLYINPYVGMDYNLYNLKKVRAVLHGTYHSGTVESNSFQLFAKKCEEEGIPVFVSPCKNMYSEIYSSVSDVLKHGVIDVYGTTSEFLYCKILVAFSLFDDIKMAVGFVKDN
ncbi:MAG: hypothetical protein IJQ50_05850, partial [Clostridia bacterium]|nr:hypothetical protein [Clostridia bacterium]